MSGRLCRYLGAWCALTLAWAGGVAAVIAIRVGDQVAASQDLARDIAALDGGGRALVTHWQDVVALLFEYRAASLAEMTLLPPLAFLAAALLYRAWRRRAPAAAVRPIYYSAAVRRVTPSRFM